MNNINIRIYSKKIDYNIILRRNITIIRGDSGTGKTTLINMIYDWMNNIGNIKVIKNTDRDIITIKNSDWYHGINISNSIIFLDESNKFIFTKEFAKFIKENNNYCVLITRKPIKTLPYSYKEIYELNSLYKNERIYTKLKNIYDIDSKNNITIKENDILITEDSKSGFQFYKYISNINGNKCMTSKGKDTVFNYISDINDNIIIADGATFGSNIDEYKELLNNNKIKLFLPESFEYILLKSKLFNLSDNEDIMETLNNINDYIDYNIYFSWENFFTHVLENISNKYGNKISYNKNKIKEWYLEESQIKKILNILPKFININNTNNSKLEWY